MLENMRLILLLAILSRIGLSHGASLEERVEILEEKLSELETDLVDNYGLVRRCRLPEVTHGLASCNFKDLKPGSKCKVICDAGWISSPGHYETVCQDGGVWDKTLKCELPLLVIAGGMEKNAPPDAHDFEVIRTHDAMNLEHPCQILSLVQSEGCNISIPNMPTINGQRRALHNLIYNPGAKELLVCNSISDSKKTTCDSWIAGKSSWSQEHSSPHKEDKLREIQKNLWASISSSSDFGYGSSAKPKTLKESRCGRYAASSLTLQGTGVVIGGSTSCDGTHTPVNTIKQLTSGYNGETYWKNAGSLKTSRSFFCAVDLMDSAFMSIGGYSEGKKILKSTEYFVLSYNWTRKYDQPSYQSRRSNSKPLYPTNLLLSGKLAEMHYSRSGHGCSLLTSDRTKIIVTGGSYQEHGAAQASSEIYNIKENQWEKTHDMKKARFGHAVVKVGDHVVAVGGSKLHPDVMTDSLEQWNPETGWSLMDNIKLAHPRANFGYTLIPHSIFEGCKLNEN